MEYPARGRYANAALSPLEDDAMEWLDGFYQLEHLIATRMWAIKICPEASPEVKFAALTHDAERFFPGGPSSTPTNGFDDPDYLFAHSTRSANIVEEWLRNRTPAPDEAFIRRVRRLILRHEIGGGWEADFVQAADSLSFLETLDWITVDWVRDGATPSRKRGRSWTSRWSASGPPSPSPQRSRSTRAPCAPSMPPRIAPWT